MPDSPLREQLMERLFAISTAHHQGPVSPQLHDLLWTGNRVVYGILADECLRQMEWARRIPAGPLDNSGFPIVVGAARDALNHWLTKRHAYKPTECEGCEFTVEACGQIAAISNSDNYKSLTLAPEDWHAH